MQSIGCSQTLSSWPVTPLIKMPSGIVIWMVSKQNYRGSSQRETSTLCLSLIHILKKVVTETADAIIASVKSDMKYKVGTMIEIPRAAITADEIAKQADFFSFGTNDLRCV